MKASEAKEITNNARNIDLTPIFGKIKASAMAGETVTAFPLDGVFAKNASDIIQRLRKEGYTVKREQGHDCRDSSSWDNLLIVW